MRIKLSDDIVKERDAFTFEQAMKISNIKRNVLWTIISRLEKKGGLKEWKKENT